MNIVSLDLLQLIALCILCGTAVCGQKIESQINTKYACANGRRLSHFSSLRLFFFSVLGHLRVSRQISFAWSANVHFDFRTLNKTVSFEWYFVRFREKDKDDDEIHIVIYIYMVCYESPFNHNLFNGYGSCWQWAGIVTQRTHAHIHNLVVEWKGLLFQF